MSKTDYLVIGAVTFVASCFAAENIGTEKNACEVYQGYRNTVDARVVYIFDPQPLNKRIGQAKYRVIGNNDLKRTLLTEDAIGKMACFTYIDPISPLGNGLVLKSVNLKTSQLEATLNKK